MVAVVFSGLTNLVLERLKAGRDQATKLCDALKTDISELQKISGDYWSSGRQKTGDAVIEARIVALQTEILATVTLLSEEFSISVANAAFLADLADALTGGDFASATRKPDLERMKASSALTTTLRTRVTAERWRRMKRTGW